MAGVPIHDDVVSEFNKMKLSKEYQWLKIGMNDKLDLINIVEKVPVSGKSYSEFVDSLPLDDCVYAVVDFHYDNEDGHRQKMIFVNWCPPKASIRKRMVYAASKQSVKDKLVGIGIEIQATDKSEVDEKAVVEKCNAVSK
ncbi:hypothetical protein ABK040_016571 [Willaertia magna]